jgi:hypothetical protein
MNTAFEIMLGRIHSSESMEREAFFRWLPPLLNSGHTEGLQVFLRTPSWYCNFNHTKEFGFLHRLGFRSHYGNITAPGPFTFSVGSSFARVRIDNESKSSAIWTFPDPGLRSFLRPTEVPFH